MRIALLGPTYPYRGGISHYTTLLCQHLRNRHDVTFFSFKRQYPDILFPGKTDKDPSEKGFKVNDVLYLLDSMNPLTWLYTGIKMVALKPDVVIIPWWVSFWTPQFWLISSMVKLFGKARLIFLCHNVVEHESGWMDKIFTKIVLKRGDSFVVHSSEDEQNLLAMFPHARIRKNFHPTYDVFNSDNTGGDVIRQKYQIKNNIILFFGFVREYKGLKYLIEALPEVLSKVDVTLMIVGEFWKDKEDYLEMIKRLKLEDKIIIIDDYIPNEEVGHYFNAANLVVQPYVSATGSGIVQLAFGFNKPVVVTNVGCLPEVVTHKKTGYVISPKRSDQLAEAINSFFLEAEEDRFTDNIKKESYHFSWDCMVDTLEDLINTNSQMN